MARKKDVYYRRFPSDWLAGVMVLAADERGVYDTIIDLLYDRAGPIKDDEKELARICGCSSPRHYRTVRDRLMELGKITRIDGMITNARFERERAKVRNVGEMSAECLEDGGPSVQGGLFGIKDLGSGILESKVQKKSPSTTAREAHAIPADFVDSVDWDYARVRGFEGLRAEDLFAAFRDHHLARATKWSDWQAAWRTWVRNEIKFNDRRQPPTGGVTSNGPRPNSGGSHDPVAAAAARRFSGDGGDGPASGPAGKIRH